MTARTTLVRLEEARRQRPRRPRSLQQANEASSNNGNYSCVVSYPVLMVCSVCVILLFIQQQFLVQKSSSIISMPSSLSFELGDYVPVPPSTSILFSSLSPFASSSSSSSSILPQSSSSSSSSSVPLSEEKTTTVRNTGGSSNGMPTSPARLLTNKVRYINWVHISKTGTSIFNTIFLHFCPRVIAKDPTIVNGKNPLVDMTLLAQYPPDVFCDVDFHHPECPGCRHPYADHGSDKTVGHHYFTMLRDPMERLKSAYSFFNKNDSISFETYANASRNQNCQLKMILGRDCYEEHVPGDRLNVSLALERIGSPRFFFGDTARWSESICLFHKQYGGVPRAFEMVNNRKTKRKDLSAEPYLKFTETVFYNEAMTIFDMRLKRAGCLNSTFEPL